MNVTKKRLASLVIRCTLLSGEARAAAGAGGGGVWPLAGLLKQWPGGLPRGPWGSLDPLPLGAAGQQAGGWEGSPSTPGVREGSGRCSAPTSSSQSSSLGRVESRTTPTRHKTATIANLTFSNLKRCEGSHRGTKCVPRGFSL